MRDRKYNSTLLLNSDNFYAVNSSLILILTTLGSNPRKPYNQIFRMKASRCACDSINPLMPDDSYRGRTALLTSKRCILYIYSTNIGTEYFKHGKNSPFFCSSKFSLFHNSNVFGSCIIHILYTGCAKI